MSSIMNEEHETISIWWYCPFDRNWRATPIWYDRAIFHVAETGTFWLCLLAIVIAGQIPRFFVKFLYQYYSPCDVQIAREAEKFGNPRELGTVQIEMNIIPDPSRRWQGDFVPVSISFSSVKYNPYSLGWLQSISLGCRIWVSLLSEG